MLTRREFVVLWAAFAAGGCAFAEVAAGVLKDDPLRPQYHLMPARGWMNDPNGPVVWKGKVHLFYQVNPTGGAQWGEISWGHAVSPDMVSWKNLPVALRPAAGYADSVGVFSGSCTVDGDRCLAFYTAVADPADKALATIHDPTQTLQERQVVAVSTDPDLLVWERQKEPLLEVPPIQPTSGFRDPSVWRDGDTWYMTVGSGVRHEYGAVLLYKASVPVGDKADWEYVHPLLSSKDRPKGADAPADGDMWECPDFFAVDGHHVLLYSAEGKVFWSTGVFDRATLTFKPAQRGVLDTGAYYAPKSFVGLEGERVLWGWIQERRPEAAYVAAGWSGAMALPRVLNVSADGQLRMKVAKQVDATLLTGKVQRGKRSLKVAGLAAKLTATLPQDGSRVKVMAGHGDLLEVKRVSETSVEINGTTIAAPVKDGVVAYVDGSVIEVFVGDTRAHTVRAYPVLSRNAGLTVEPGHGAEATLQAIRPISPDRLTGA